MSYNFRSWATLVCLILFTFAFMTGLSPIPWILVGELPTTMKGVVAGKCDLTLRTGVS